MFDFVIIGGGIIGLLTAKALQETGATIAVIEKNSPGQQATWAAGGILSPMRPWHYSDAVNAISASSQPIYQQLSEELHAQTGIDPEWIQSGMLVLHDDEMADALDWCNKHRAPHDMLSVDQLNSQFAHLKPLQAPALLRADVATIRPHKLLAALATYLRQNKVTFYNDCVEALLPHQQSISGAQLSDRVVQGSNYIICGGAWSANLLPNNTPKPDISPVKGQMICFPPTEISNHCMVMDGNRYIIPRKDGRVVVGSTRENTGFDASTTQQAFDDLGDFAQQLFPALSSSQPDAHWAGLRPSSPNSIPYICRVEPYDNLSLNAGHYRNGIVTAPASAELITDLLLKRTSSTDLSPYQLVR